MNSTARKFETASDCISHAAAVRNRLMNPANAFRQEKSSPVLRIVNRAAARPSWRQETTRFDEHVRAYQWHLANNQCSKVRAYIINRCKELGADYLQVIGPSQTKEICGPRQIIWYELRTKMGVSYPRIAREFGGRDHTTVISGVNRVAELMGDVPPEYQSGTQRLLADPELKAKVKAAHLRGDTLEEISVAFDISERAITTVGKSENWYRGSNRNRTSYQTVSVNLSALRGDYERWPQGLKALGAKHGISERTVSRLAARYGWIRRKRDD